MLRNLHIKNLALIHEIDVDFSEGLNILTGETGAGKSIIIDSISLALGGRVTRDMTHSKEPALSELVFEVSDPDALKNLSLLDVQAEDGVVVISRKIVDGRSTLRVNGETRTASDVRRLAGSLLDIHGQSEHQKLLNTDMQLSLLDDYGKERITPQKAEVAKAYHLWNSIRRELGEEELSEEERARRISFLEFEIGEIEDAGLKEGEDEEIELLYKKLANSRKISEAIEEVHIATGYDEAASAGEIIGRALKKLEGVSSYDDSLQDFTDQLSEIDSLLNDFNRAISDYGDNLSFEAESFQETEERLNLLNKLKVKYGNTIEAILDYRDKKQDELNRLLEYEEHRSRLQTQLEQAEDVLKQASAKLTKLRQEYAETFTREVTKQLSGLNFARVDFALSFKENASYSANGKDTVTYMISTNPGSERGPLNKVVSGGELSRIMLGIRTMFADSDTTDTLIFDEIDTGISGRTAQKVAEKLAQVAKHHQVLCITHLPQIAAMADTHYGITKSLSDSEAITEIQRLDDCESVDELARMLGGAEITENTRNSAREMQEMCRQFKLNVL